MRSLILALALACSTVQAQGLSTEPWKPSQPMVAGAIVSVFANIYTTQSGKYKHPQLVAILITMGFGLAYEAMRYLEGKKPLMGNAFYAGVGAVPVSFTFSIRF